MLCEYTQLNINSAQLTAFDAQLAKTGSEANRSPGGKGLGPGPGPGLGPGPGPGLGLGLGPGSGPGLGLVLPRGTWQRMQLEQGETKPVNSSEQLNKIS